MKAHKAVTASLIVAVVAAVGGVSAATAASVAPSVTAHGSLMASVPVTNLPYKLTPEEIATLLPTPAPTDTPSPTDTPTTSSNGGGNGQGAAGSGSGATSSSNTNNGGSSGGGQVAAPPAPAPGPSLNNYGCVDPQIRLDGVCQNPPPRVQYAVWTPYVPAQGVNNCPAGTNDFDREHCDSSGRWVCPSNGPRGSYGNGLWVCSTTNNGW